VGNVLLDPIRQLAVVVWSDQNVYFLDHNGVESIERISIEGGRPVSGTVLDQDRYLYLTVEISGKGHVQKYSVEGDLIWESEITSQNYFKQPLLVPNSDYIIFNNELIDQETGQLYMPPGDIIIQQIISSKTGTLYAKNRGTIVQLNFDSGEWSIAEAAVKSALEDPIEFGITPNNLVWLLGFRNGEAVIEWYSSDGAAVGSFEKAQTYLAQLAYLEQIQQYLACGWAPPGIEADTHSICFIISPITYSEVARIQLGSAREVVTGIANGSNTIWLITDQGNLFKLDLDS
jgi:hypothetical protein